MLRYRLDTALRIFLNCHAERAEAPMGSRYGRLHRLRVAASAQQGARAPRIQNPPR